MKAPVLAIYDIKEEYVNRLISLFQRKTALPLNCMDLLIRKN